MPRSRPTPVRREKTKAEVRAVTYRWDLGAPSPIGQLLRFFQLATARARAPSPMCLFLAGSDWRKLARAVRRWVEIHTSGNRQLREAVTRNLIPGSMPYTNDSLPKGQAEYVPHRSIDPE